MLRATSADIRGRRATAVLRHQPGKPGPARGPGPAPGSRQFPAVRLYRVFADDGHRLAALMGAPGARGHGGSHQHRGVETPAFRPERKRRFTSPEMSVPDGIFELPATAKRAPALPARNRGRACRGCAGRRRDCPACEPRTYSATTGRGWNPRPLGRWRMSTQLRTRRTWDRRLRHHRRNTSTRKSSNVSIIGTPFESVASLVPVAKGARVRPGRRGRDVIAATISEAA